MRIYILLIGLILGSLVSGGCQDKEVQGVGDNQGSKLENGQIASLPEDQEKQPIIESDQTDKVEIYVYTDVFAPDISLEKIPYDVDACTPENVKLGIEQELSKVYEFALQSGDLSLDIESISQEGNRVIVDFAQHSFPGVGAGSQQERDVLNSIALTVIHNLPNATEVCFRVAGGDYESGHFIFGKDELYDVESIQLP